MSDSKYEDLFSPEGAAHIGRTISGILELLGQAAGEIDALKARVAALERKNDDLWSVQAAALLGSVLNYNELPPIYHDATVGFETRTADGDGKETADERA